MVVKEINSLTFFSEDWAFHFLFIMLFIYLIFTPRNSTSPQKLLKWILIDLSQIINFQREEKQRKFILLSTVDCFHKKPRLRCSLSSLRVIPKFKTYIFRHFVNALDAILVYEKSQGFIEVFSP